MNVVEDLVHVIAVDAIDRAVVSDIANAVIAVAIEVAAATVEITVVDDPVAIGTVAATTRNYQIE